MIRTGALPYSQGEFASYACPTCGGHIENSCACGRARGEWLLAEEAIVVSKRRAGASRVTASGESEGVDAHG